MGAGERKEERGGGRGGISTTAYLRRRRPICHGLPRFITTGMSGSGGIRVLRAYNANGSGVSRGSWQHRLCEESQCRQSRGY
jgi:hypothetical protein